MHTRRHRKVDIYKRSEEDIKTQNVFDNIIKLHCRWYKNYTIFTLSLQKKTFGLETEGLSQVICRFLADFWNVNNGDLDKWHWLWDYKG
jgi:hypothetical protein